MKTVSEDSAGINPPISDSEAMHQGCDSILGMFAFSRAGHDKGHIYIIIKEEEEYVYVADGGIKTVESPKRKNKKHIQIMKKNADYTIVDKLNNHNTIRNEDLKRAIKQYVNQINGLTGEGELV